MAIAFVNGAKNDSTSAVATLTTTYSPKAGNTVIVFLATATASTACTCADSASVALIAGPTVANTNVIYSFYYTATGAPTNFKASWTTTSECSMTVLEYSVTGGVIIVNGNLATKTATGTSTAPSITPTTQDANDFIVGGLANGSSDTITISSGTSREQVTASTSRLLAGDKTSVTATTVTISGTMTSAAWVAVAIELRFIIQPTFIVAATGGTTAGTSTTVTISPDTRSLVTIAVALLLTTDSVSSITDSIGKTVYKLQQAIDNSTVARIELWTGFIVGNPTTITVNYATTTAAVAIAQYGGIAVLGLQSTGTVTGTSASLSQTTTDKNNILVEAIAAGGNSSYASGTGTLRTSLTQNSVIGVGLADNTSATIASVTVAITLGTSLGVAQAMTELGSVPLSPVFKDIQDDYNSYDTHLTQGFLSNAIAEANLGDNVEVPPVVLAANDIILMGYRGYWIPRSNMVPWDQDIQKLPPIVVTLFNDWTNDSEYQKDFTWRFSSDTIVDEMVELLPQLYFASSVTLMGWSGYSIPTSSMINADDGVEQITLNPSTLFNDWTNDAENPGFNFELNQALFGSILPEAGIGDNIELPPTAPAIAWTLDIENQLDWLNYTFDIDQIDDQVEKIPVVVTIFNDWTNDAENQLDRSWSMKDHLIDEEVEKIFIPVVAYDNDADTQLANPLYQGLGSDQGQDWQYLIIIPSTVPYLFFWDNDAENQKDNSWRIGDDVSDSGVEKIFIPVVAYDNDSDNQKDNTWRFSSDTIADEMVEILPQLYFASTVTLMSWKGYYVPVASMFFQDEMVEKFQIPLTIGWDNDSDNQKDNSWRFSSDDESDVSVEKIFIPTVAYDTDADNQLANPLYQGLPSDQGQDWQYLIIIPSSVPYLFFWDNDAENQKDNSWRIGDDLADAGVEHITIPTVAYDNDSDNQKDNSWRFSSDDVLDSQVERIQLALTIGWDTDADNQKDNSWRFGTDTLSDENVERIQLALTIGWDTDADQQRDNTWKVLIDDESDFGLERIFIPVVAYDTDADNQLLNPSYIGVGSDQGQDWIQLIIVPAVVSYLYSQDNDADHQKDNSWRIGDDISDSGVERIVIPTIAYEGDSENQKSNAWIFSTDHLTDEGIELVEVALAWDTDADHQFSNSWIFTQDDESDSGVEILTQIYLVSDIVLLGYKGYWVPKALMIFTDDSVERIQLALTTAWDNDSDNQIQQLGYNLDRDNADTGVEHITIPTVAYDTDADNQLLQSLFYVDDENDFGIELIQPNLYLGWDTDADNQLAQLGYYQDRDVSDASVEKIFIPVVAYDTDADNQLSNPLYQGLGSDQGQDWNLVIIIPPIVLKLTAFDTDAEQQKDFSWRVGDDLADTGVEYITIPTVAYDNDSDNQKDNSWRFSSDTVSDETVERIQIALTIGWDTDAENQRQQDGYATDRDVSDPQTERIVIPITAYDDDGQGQVLNPLYTLDKDGFDSAVELVQIPTVAYDNDADEQKAQLPYQGLGSDQGQEWIQLIIIPPIVSLLYAYDNDAENQLDRSWRIGDDVSDSGVEKIFIPVVAYDTDADNQKDNSWNFSSDTVADEMIEILPQLYFASSITLMSWKGYFVPVASMFFQDEMVEKFQIALTTGWDNDAENQKDNTWRFSSDDENDTSVEKIFLPFNIWDNDADNQLANPLYQGLPSDQGQDWNLVIIVPPIVSLLYAYDNDAENQKDNSWHIGDDLADTGVEHITIPTVAYDTDADNQRDNSWKFSSDDILDSQVERIQIALIIGWDTDADNQLDRTWRFGSDHLLDEGVERISIPIVAYDNDSDNQKDNSWFFRTDHLIDEEVEKIFLPFNIWDTDADNQLLNPSYVGVGSDQGQDWQYLIIIPPIVPYLYAQDTDADHQKDISWRVKDDVMDPDVEIIILPYRPLDEFGVDIPPSRFVPDLAEEAPYIIVYEPLDIFDEPVNIVMRGFVSSDQGQDTTNYIIIPTVAYDNDADGQLPSPTYQGLPSDQGQDWIQLLIVPPIVNVLYAYDNDADYQKEFTWRVTDDLMDSGVERIQLALITGWDTDADNQKDNTWQVRQDFADPDIDFRQVTLGWDTDADQQMSNAWIFKSDHLADETVERIQIALTTGWDNDADQQHDNSWRVEDDVMDSGVEKITLDLILSWDTDADQQKSNDWIFRTDTLADENVEYITIPTVAYDTDADQQKDNSWFFRSDSQDEREGTNYIILPFNDWTSPFEDQLDRSWHIGDDVLDAGIEIIVPPVPIFVLGGGQVVPLLSVSGSSTLQVNSSGEVQLTTVGATSKLVINASGEVELIVVKANLINSGDK